MNNNDTPPPGKQCWLGVDGCCFCLHFSTNSTYRFDFELSRLMFPTCRMGHSVNLSPWPCGETEPGCHSHLCPCQINFCWPVAWHFVIETIRCGSICPCCSFTSVFQQIFKNSSRTLEENIIHKTNDHSRQKVTDAMIQSHCSFPILELQSS